MDELNNKLNNGSPALVAQYISKLVQIINDQKQGNILETADYKFLREKCTSVNNPVSIVAADGVLRIAADSDPAIIKSMITDFMSIITTTKCSANTTYLINNLLLIELTNEMSTNKSCDYLFNLGLSHHPLIIMLNEDSNCWPSILNEIVYTYTTNDSKNSYDILYKPVFLYALCCPRNTQLVAFRQKLWEFIIQISTKDNSILQTLLLWMQFENKDLIQLNSSFLIELSNSNNHNCIIDKTVLIYLQISSLHQLLINNFDCRAMIASSIKSLQEVKRTEWLSPVLLMLAKCVKVCPTVYLLELLKLCKALITVADLDAVIGNVFRASLIEWIANPSDLISEALVVANELYSSLSQKKYKKLFRSLADFYRTNELLNTNSEVYLFIQVYIAVAFCTSELSICNWLEKLESAPIYVVAKMYDFLVGLFLTKLKDETVTIKIFDLLLRCVEYNKNLGTNLFTVTLLKLPDVTDSNLHYKILKALPKMAVNKNKLQQIIRIILALHKSSNILKTFSLSLMLDLWKIDNKYYNFLEDLLIIPYDNECDKWEFYVTRAHTLKELCALKPELYGKEIVAHLSKILNECNHADGALPTALAIEGITYLCKSEIIDVVTTWATLEPKFKEEIRIPVIKSLCGLISEIPSLSYSDSHPKLIEDTVAKLWNYIELNPDDEVWKSALDALTHFSVDQIVGGMPEDYLDEENLNIRKTGRVVPGNCWIQFMKNSSKSKLKIVGDFLIKLVSLEISNYLKFVYQVKGTREPVDYSYLPENSVVRGLSTYIKSKILKWNSDIYKPVFLECLRVFSQEYSKPLPPLDWCFLQELFHENETKEYCIHIAAHQVTLSGTARRFIVNYIEALTQDYQNENDVVLVYQNLKHLAKSVQPVIMKPFLHVTINQAIERYENPDDSDLIDYSNRDFLLDVVSNLQKTMSDENIQEANKLVIIEVISNIIQNTEHSLAVFERLTNPVIFFPIKAIDDLTYPTIEKSDEWVPRAINLRSSHALYTESTVNFLNDLYELGKYYPGFKTLIFEEYAPVSKKYMNNTDCVLWLFDLFGQMQAKVAEKSEEKHILILCDVFIYATLMFSGYFVFLKKFTDEKMYQVFPRALAALLEVDHWSIFTNQVLEWFHHTITEKILPVSHRKMFARCLQCLKHETEFNKNMKWMKYLNAACYDYNMESGNVTEN